MAIGPIKEKYDLLLAFFKWWVPLYLPGTNLYFYGQGTPRPAQPYVSVNIKISSDAKGRDENLIGMDDKMYLRGFRNFQCRLEAFADSPSRYDGSLNSWEMLEELRFSLGYPDVEEHMMVASFSLRESGIIDETSHMINTTLEMRAAWVLSLSTAILQDIDTTSGAIENINALGGYSANGQSVSTESDVTTSKP